MYKYIGSAPPKGLAPPPTISPGSAPGYGGVFFREHPNFCSRKMKHCELPFLVALRLFSRIFSFSITFGCIAFCCRCHHPNLLAYWNNLEGHNISFAQHRTFKIDYDLTFNFMSEALKILRITEV